MTRLLLGGLAGGLSLAFLPPILGAAGFAACITWAVLGVAR